MAHRHELSEAEWTRIARFLRAAGCQWRDLPERYGPWSTVHSRLRRWSHEGLWEHRPAARRGAQRRAGA